MVLLAFPLRSAATLRTRRRLMPSGSPLPGRAGGGRRGVPVRITVVGPADLPELLPLARDDAARAVGFATLYWTWQTLVAARVGVMNDLFVAAKARGTGVADALVAACLERCREHGATRLVWQTAIDNGRAQAVYERLGAIREDRWLHYELPVSPA